MITIEYTADGGVLSLTARGHADYAPRGVDIVCAAATALILALAQSASEHYASGALTAPASISLTPGDSRVVASPREDHLPLVKNSYDTVFCGFAVLAHNFPDHVRAEKSPQKNDSPVCFKDRKDTL